VATPATPEHEVTSAMAKKSRSEVESARDEARSDALSAFLRQMAKDMPGEVNLLGASSAVRIATVPTGAISLDLAIGAGGFPRGRIIELYGPESSGKTTLALQVARNVQQGGGVVGFIDAEHALNLELCDNIGIDRNKFVVVQPDHGEAAIDMVEKMIESNAFEMIIVDSVAAMVPKAEIDGDVEQQFMGLHARLMSRFMRRVAGLVSRSNVMLVLVNQVRKDLGAYGTPDTTTGGRAIKFYASLRIEVRSSASKKITRGKDVVGIGVTATVRKNKLAPPFRVAEYDVIFGHGIDGSGSLIDACESTGVLVRSGASYAEAATGERLAIGKENLKTAVAENDELRERLTAAVYAQLRSEPIDAEEALVAESTDAAYEALAQDLGREEEFVA
jgi:recombination protein RecA